MDILKTLGLISAIVALIVLRCKFLPDTPNDDIDPFVTIGIGIIFFIVAIASFIL
jgi:hypothetical protein